MAAFRIFPYRREGVLLALTLVVWGALASAGLPARAAELIMFERTGCVWCLRWDREIGPIYPKTEEGRLAPLRHVSLDRGPPAEMGLAEPVFYTPTFVLMDDGREVGRITGYIGEDAFWGLLGQMVGRLAKKPSVDPEPQKTFLDRAVPLLPAFAGLITSDK